MSFPEDRERWFQFRSERLRTCMEAWLSAHGVEPVERQQWDVPAGSNGESGEARGGGGSAGGGAGGGGECSK